MMGRLKPAGKLLACLTLATMLLGMAATASADYYLDGQTPVNSPASFEMSAVWSDFGDAGGLNSPSDIFIDKHDNVFILDTANRRVLKTDAAGRLLRVYEGAYGPENKPLDGAKGLFVDDDGSLLIADTKNARIVHLAENGDFIEQFTQPVEDTYDTAYPFLPTKVAVDSLGRIYIANTFDYHGLITIDGNNRFLGYIGATKIGFNPLDALLRAVASQEQRDKLARSIPAYFSNFLVTGDNMIYTTSLGAERDQIQKLTPAGKNIYARKFYSETNTNTDYNRKPALADVAVDRHGIVYAIDAATNMLYAYDQEGRSLTAIGGTGKRQRLFAGISSVAVNSRGDLYVTDEITHLVQVLRPTALMTGLIEAATRYNNAEYEQAVPYWRQVLALDNTNRPAITGMAKATYRAGEYREALAQYEEILDQAGYSDAFYNYRLSLVREHFLLLALGALVLIVGLALAVSRLARFSKRAAVEPLPVEKDRAGVRVFGRIALLMVFHPLDGFDKIKQYRRRLRLWPVAFLLLALAAVQLLSIYGTHFPFSDPSLRGQDIVRQLSVFFVPLISWIAVCFGLTAIADGKQSLKEAISASLYAFVPYLVFTPLLTLASHLLCLNEGVVYALLTGGVMIWSILLLLVSGIHMNEYRYTRLPGLIIKNLFAMLCLWLVVCLFYIVVYQFVGFIQKLYFEVTVMASS